MSENEKPSLFEVPADGKPTYQQAAIVLAAGVAACLIGARDTGAITNVLLLLPGMGMVLGGIVMMIGALGREVAPKRDSR